MLMGAFSLEFPLHTVSFSKFWSDSLSPHEEAPPWDFPDKNIGAGCPFLLQGIEPASPALQVDSLPLNHFCMYS